MTKSMSKLLEGLLYLFFLFVFIVWATLPWKLDDYLLWSLDVYITNANYRLYILIFSLVAGFAVLWILGELILIIRSLGSDPFVARNVRALNRIGISGSCIALLFISKCFVYVTPLTIACGALLLMCSLFALVLRDVFHKAVLYKEENDLTI